MIKMETVQQTFSAGMRAILDLIAQKHNTSISSLIEDGMIEGMILLAKKIPKNLSQDWLKEFSPYFVETIINMKKERYQYPMNVPYLDTMKKLHDKGKIKKDQMFFIPPKTNIT